HPAARHQPPVSVPLVAPTTAIQDCQPPAGESRKLMTYRALTRAAIAAAATTAALLPLAACSAGDGGGSRSSTNPSEPLPSPASSSSSEAPTTRPTASTGEYTDGIYTARGIYGGAPAYMAFPIRLAGGK